MTRHAPLSTPVHSFVRLRPAGHGLRAILLFFLALLVPAAYIQGQTSKSLYLYGGVVLDDKLLIEGTEICFETCQIFEGLGTVCTERCDDPSCTVDTAHLSSYLNITNPNDQAAAFDVEVRYFDGTLAFGSVDWTLPARGKLSQQLDELFQRESHVYIVLSSTLPLEASVETLHRDIPSALEDPLLDLQTGVDTPLVPLTSTLWRSGSALTVVNNANSDDHVRPFLYLVNPHQHPARGQVRLSRGGQVGGLDPNVNWTGCLAFDLGPGQARVVDVQGELDGSAELLVGFLEVDTGRAQSIGTNCLANDPLAGSVFTVLLHRDGLHPEINSCNDPPNLDFAEPVYGHIPTSLGFQLR